MRIAILTFHRAHNCGAMLQAWALQTILERMGHCVEFPACNDIGHIPTGLFCTHIPKEKKGLQWWRSLLGRICLDMSFRRMGTPQNRLYNAFRKKFLNERRCLPAEFARYYDLVVVGSDQVFSLPHIGKWKNLFYCIDIPAGLPLVAYAASIGEHCKTESDSLEFARALCRFKAVSFREPFAEYPVVCDPTLLLDSVEYGCLPQNHLPDAEGDYMYMYSIYMTEFEVAAARKLAQKLNLKLVITPVYPDGVSSSIPEATELLSPERMVQYVRNAQYVLAGSFHATALAIVFRKPFLSFRPKPGNPAVRMSSLLERIGLHDRLVDSKASFEKMLSVIKSPISDTADERLSAWRNESMAWLKSSLA